MEKRNRCKTFLKVEPIGYDDELNVGKDGK